jgi:hypothetical protein
LNEINVRRRKMQRWEELEKERHDRKARELDEVLRKSPAFQEALELLRTLNKTSVSISSPQAEEKISFLSRVKKFFRG